MSSSADAFFNAQRAENQVEQALLTTGNAANLTAEELKKVASELQAVSNFDGDDILADVTGSLLTFKNIAGDTFLRTQQIVVDMAEKFGGLQNSAMQVGFALNSPSEGMTRLRRTGIQFSEQQIEQIKLFEETNQIVKAQTIMLEELESQFGGLAKASINPITQMKNSWGDLVESIGSSFVPIFKNFASFADTLANNENLAGILATSMKIGLAVGIAVATKAVIGLIVKMKTLITTMSIAKALSGDWISLLLSVGVGIGSVALMTKDWTKEQEELNKSLATGEEEATKLLNTTRILLGENSKTVEENKSLAVAVKTLADKYNILIPLEGGRAEALKKINDELNKQAEIQPVDPSKVIVDQISDLERMLANAEALVEKYRDKDLYDITNAEKIKAWFQGYSPSQQLTEAGKVFMDNKKAVEDYNLKIAELRSELIELENASNNVTVDVVPKDLSALETYYNTVKFADSSYFDFKTALNTQEADEYQKLLISKGYSEQEALSFRNKYYGQKNSELLEAQRTWIEEMQAISDSYAPQQQAEDITWDTSWMEGMKSQKEDIAKYYETVKDLDSNYYQWKAEQIALEVENMAISDEQKAILLEQRLDNITRETEAYRSHAISINTVVGSITNSLVSFAQISTSNLSNVEKLWANLANAVIADIGRMMAKMIAMKVLQASLSFLNPLGGVFGMFGASGGTTIGVGIPDIVGGYASAPTLSYSSTGSSSSNNSNAGIINKLNEVVKAINSNSIKNKIRTIDKIELSQIVEAGDMARGVK